MSLRGLPPRARVIEVGPRDGFQNEPVPIDLETKVAFIDALSDAGYDEIEVSAFVSPRRVPQLSDAEEVFRRIRRAPGTVYSALVPNERGLERALAVKVDRIAVFTAASETFNRHNIHASIAESIARFRPVVDRARRAGLGTRGYVSCAFVCPFEGPIPPAKTREVVERLRDLGVDEVSIGDTIGAAVPSDIDRTLDELEEIVPAERIALHLHDTRGTALANALIGLQRGIRSFDSSAGGLGGCPFAPGATGNLPTEDLLFFLDGLGIETGILRNALDRASDIAERALGHALPSRVRRSGPVRLPRIGATTGGGE
jgi:hydroxymethylglutaryl-CoA lyase